MLKAFAPIHHQIKLQGHSVDLFLPDFCVAIEYQGGQHYVPTHRGNFAEYSLQLQTNKNKFLIDRSKERNKKKDLMRCGITLIHIPFWWNGSVSQLEATIIRQIQVNLSMMTLLGQQIGKQVNSECR